MKPAPSTGSAEVDGWQIVAHLVSSAAIGIGATVLTVDGGTKALEAGVREQHAAVISTHAESHTKRRIAFSARVRPNAPQCAPMLPNAPQ